MRRFRPMPRSIRETAAARWPTGADRWSGSTPRSRASASGWRCRSRITDKSSPRRCMTAGCAARGWVSRVHTFRCCWPPPANSATTHGLQIASAVAGSPAAKRLRRGDIAAQLLTVRTGARDRHRDSATDGRRRVARRIEVTVWRNGALVDVFVVPLATCLPLDRIVVRHDRH